MFTASRPLANLLIALVASAPLDAAQDVKQVEIDHLEERLQYLADDYETALVTHNIPGMAVAVVKDDKIIFAKGFGLADMESGRKVTPQTRFAIGSTTKAFTTVLLGMLVDEALVEWDAPITEYLPYFELPIDSKHEDDQVTLRDMLCHRTGFTRMGLLWASGMTTREESLRTATNAEPWSGFRKKFFYNNVMYLAAGMAAGAASDSSWDVLLQERLFDPLGMQTSNANYKQAVADEGMALGYKWLSDLKMHKRDPMRNIDLIGPAGAINSNVIEMSNWLRLQLGRGEFEGQRLISEAALTDAWEPNIRVGGGIKYGMGWMINKYHGQRALHHGGNIDGFAAAVALLPDSNIGYVMLTNIGSTPLQAPTSTLVWDALLADFELRGEKSEAEEGAFDEFLGPFMASFGPFKDDAFEVSVNNGALFVDIPGQINGELLPADEDGMRVMKPAPHLQFRFQRNATGDVIMLVLHQAGASFEMYRKDHVFALDMPMEDFEQFLGRYDDPSFKTPVEVKVHHGHLAADVPGQTIYEMNLPDEEGLWAFSAVPSISIEFEYDDDDQVCALVRHQGGELTRCERILGDAEPAGNSLPSLAEIDELRHLQQRLEARAKLGSVIHRAEIRFVHAGISGALEEINTPDGRFIQHVVMGKFGFSDTAFDGRVGWSHSSFDVYDEPEGMLHTQLMLTSITTYLGDWNKLFDQRKVLRSAKLNGQEHWVIELVKGQLPPVTLFINKETGDLTRANSMAVSGGSGVQLPIHAEFSDYREINGLRIPFTIRKEDASSGATIMTYLGMDTQVQTTPETFKHQD